MELDVLKQKIVRVKGTCISRIRELSNPSVYLCLHGQNLLLRKRRLDEELSQAVIFVDGKLGLISEVGPRKRTLSETTQE